MRNLWILAAMLALALPASADWDSTSRILSPGKSATFTWDTTADSTTPHLATGQCGALLISYEDDIEGSDTASSANVLSCPAADSAAGDCSTAYTGTALDLGSVVRVQPGWLMVDVIAAPGTGKSRITVYCGQEIGSVGGGGGAFGSGPQFAGFSLADNWWTENWTQQSSWTDGHCAGDSASQRACHVPGGTPNRPGLDNDCYHVYEGLDATADVNSATENISATRHLFKNAHPTEVYVRLDSGALPTGLAANTNYWIIKVDEDTFALASTFSDAITGTKVNLTAAAGTFSVLELGQCMPNDWTVSHSETTISLILGATGLSETNAGLSTPLVSYMPYLNDRNTDTIGDFGPVVTPPSYLRVCSHADDIGVQVAAGVDESRTGVNPSEQYDNILGAAGPVFQSTDGGWVAEVCFKIDDVSGGDWIAGFNSFGDLDFFRPSGLVIRADRAGVFVYHQTAFAGDARVRLGPNTSPGAAQEVSLSAANVPSTLVDGQRHCIAFRVDEGADPADGVAVFLDDVQIHVLDPVSMPAGATGSQWSPIAALISDSADVGGIDSTTDIDAGADEITITGHPYYHGQGPVTVTATSGSLPGGLAASTQYWIVTVDDDTIQLSRSFWDTRLGTCCGADQTVVNLSTASGTFEIDAGAEQCLDIDRWTIVQK